MKYHISRDDLFTTGVAFEQQIATYILQQLHLFPRYLVKQTIIIPPHRDMKHTGYA